MSQSAVLEREPYTSAANSPEAIAHKKKSEEIYSKYFSSDETDEELARKIGAEFRSADSYAPSASSEAPVRGRELFADYDYKDHSLIHKTQPSASAAVAPVPAAIPAEVPAARPAKAPAAELDEEDPDNEDLRPTPRTMRVRSSANERKVESQLHVGFFASLSNTARLVLALVAAAVVVAIALVCINTGIINSLDADIQDRRSELQELNEYSESLNEQIREVTSPDYVDAYAEDILNMTRS